MDSIDVILTEILSIDKNVVKVHNDKDVQLLGKDLIDEILKVSWNIW